MVAPESLPATTRPAPGRRWAFGDWLGAAVRVVLLLVLLAGVTAVLASLHPAPREQSDLTADLAAGRVTYLEYERIDNAVRWSDGTWRWRVATLVRVDSPAAGTPPDDPMLDWLQRQAAASSHPVPVRVRDGSGSRWWPDEVVWEPLQAATVTAWVLTFLLMLSRSTHRYANRWAWFWLFLIGQVGVLLYLILEPQPIWRPRSWPPRTGRAPTGGGMGLAWAILLSFVLSLVLTLTGARFG